MSAPIKILFIHGIGFQEEENSWQSDWNAAALNGIQAVDATATVQASYFDYDQMFKDNDAPNTAMVGAVAEMLGSWVVGKVGGIFGRSRGILEDATHSWDARPGMVAEWAGDTKLRAALRAKLLAEVQRFQPDVIAAHSLGSLLSYDWLRTSPAPGDALIKKLTFLTFGCQISNPALVPVFGGQVLMPGVKQWINLWNKQDPVFVDSIRLNEDGFREVSLGLPSGHDGTGYLNSRGARDTAWNQIALTYGDHTGLSRALLRGANAGKESKIDALGKLRQTRMKARPSKKQKALLIGINQYANPANNLEGCVNDVFEMSAMLQECGFDADDIRIVLDERATTAGIKDRMEWLLDGARGEDKRFLFYSGHGAQIPIYGDNDVPRKVDECLVPHDFAWTTDTAIVDEWFYQLYANLPYTVEFAAMLDCCHSGGMARDGGARIRGLNPPDDIRHRAIRWEPKYQMWVPRDQFDKEKEKKTDKVVMNMALNKNVCSLGSGDVARHFGRLRRHPHSKTEVHADKPFGPYHPLLLKACGKNEVAMEYRHGTQSFGAFTYCMTRLLRRQSTAKLSFIDLIHSAKQQLATLGYDQHPGIEGPDVRRNDIVPWEPYLMIIPSKPKTTRSPLRSSSHHKSTVTNQTTMAKKQTTAKAATKAVKPAKKAPSAAKAAKKDKPIAKAIKGAKSKDMTPSGGDKATKNKNIELRVVAIVLDVAAANGASKGTLAVLRAGGTNLDLAADLNINDGLKVALADPFNRIVRDYQGTKISDAEAGACTTVDSAITLVQKVC